MAKSKATVELVAITTVRRQEHGRGKEEVHAPGKAFHVPADEVEHLVLSGAARRAGEIDDEDVDDVEEESTAADTRVAQSSASPVRSVDDLSDDELADVVRERREARRAARAAHQAQAASREQQAAPAPRAPRTGGRKPTPAEESTPTGVPANPSVVDEE